MALSWLEAEACMQIGDLVTFDDLVPARPAWMADAACLEHPEINFVPGPGESTDAPKAVCAGCLVRRECLAFGRTNREVGVWGGKVLRLPSAGGRRPSVERQSTLAAEVARWQRQALAHRAKIDAAAEKSA